MVIPALNECEGIKIVIREALSAGVKPDHIIVVDGGSTDCTRDVATGLGARVIEQNGRGKGGAIIEAISHLIGGDTDRDIVLIIIDADATYPASETPRLVSMLLEKRLSEVIGERRYGRENIPLLNRFGNRVLTAVFNLIHGTRLMDVLSGFYALRLRDYWGRDGLLIKARGFDIEVEIAGIAACKRGVAGYPIRYRRRVGVSKLSSSYVTRLKVFIRILVNILRSGWRFRRKRLVALVSAVLLAILSPIPLLTGRYLFSIAMLLLSAALVTGLFLTRG